MVRTQYVSSLSKLFAFLVAAGGVSIPRTNKERIRWLPCVSQVVEDNGMR